MGALSIFKHKDSVSTAPNRNMEVPSGTRLGRYEVRSLLGVGGMGEVYLAQDLQLRRPVALKLLPPQFTRDEERLRRFKQEAFAASSLNHPNIFTIFEIGQQGDTHFIATEYIDGHSLRQLAGQGPIELYQVLDWGIQIASALAAAHSAGIIHRDIKPDNIMVRRDGYVKVLDFGLAKLTEYKNLASDPEAATAQVIQTDPGKVMGTASYMSPEQTRGLQLDERTDIWSLGVIVYELIAGRPPFEGISASDVVASILRTEPVPLHRFSPDVPNELQRIVRKALRKDPDERYHLAKEMAIDLKNLRRDLELNAEIERSVQPFGSDDRRSGMQSHAHLNISHPASETAPVSQQRSTATGPFSNNRPQYSTASKLVIGVIVLTLIVVGFVSINYWIKGTRSVEPATEMRITRLTTTGRVDQAVISPDGKYVVHAVAENGLQSLRVRQVNTNSDREVVPPADVYYHKLIFSRDGDFVYYVATDRNGISSNLYSIDVLGGSARKLISNVTSAVTLSPDGQSVAFIRNMADVGEDVVVIADATGGNERKIAARKLPNFFGSIAWSPKGNSIVCAAGSFVPAYNTYLIEMRLDDPKEKQLGSKTWSSMGEIAWVPDSSGLVFTASDPDSFGPDSQQVWNVRYPEGEARRITNNDLNNYRGVSVTSDSKRLVTLQTASTCHLWVANNSDLNQPTQVTTGSRLDGRNGVAFMTDGQVVYSASAGGNMDLWVMNSDGGNQRQLTANSRNNTQPVVTRDGRYVVFSSDRSGTSNIWRVDQDGTNPRQLTSGSGEVNPHFSPDAKSVVYTLLGAGKPTIWRVSIEGGAPEKIIDGYATNPVVSPDGKSIACSYREQPNARMKIGLFSINGGEPIRTFDLGAMPVFDSTSSVLRWTADGRGITYVLNAGDVSNLWIQPVSGEPAKQMTSFKSSRIFSFDWSPDGQKLILSRGTATSDVVLISNFR